MGKVGFNYPIFLTLIHYTVSWILMALFKALAWLPASPPSKSTPFSSLFSLGIVMALSNGLANTSLQHNRFSSSSRSYTISSYETNGFNICYAVSFIYIHISFSQCWLLPDGEDCCNPNHCSHRIHLFQEDHFLQ